jgi:NADPH-dependent ferric siderophore reductase
MRLSTWTKTTLAAFGMCGLLLVGFGEGLALRGDDDVAAATAKVTGKVRAYTEAPKGEKDGMRLADGTVIHWPPHLGERFAAIAKIGDRVVVVGRRETRKEGDEVIEARSVTNLDTDKSFANDDEGPPPKKGPDKKGPDKKGPKDRVVTDRTVNGTVRRLTGGPKGETDGAELEDGTVVHWPPHLGERFASIVKRGDRVEVVGWDETKPKGEKVLEVRTVLNLATKERRTNDDAPPARPSAGQATESSDVNARLRALEQKVDTLIDEIRQLRRK